MDGLNWHSSDVDWCEDNYQFHPYVAEWWNTFSNLPFFFAGILAANLYSDYGKQTGLTLQIALVWLCIFVVGVGSMWFHWTLSYVGQLLDEIGILWVLLAAVAVWTPSYYHRYFGVTPAQWQIAVWIVCAVLTPLFFVYPILNMFGLMILGITIVSIEYREYQYWKAVIQYNKNRDSTHSSNGNGFPAYHSDVVAMDPAVPKIVSVGLTVFISAVTVWVNDRFLCVPVWSHFYRLPYVGWFFQLHAWWHLLICISSYLVICFCSYFYALENYRDKNPVIAYWPRWAIRRRSIGRGKKYPKVVNRVIDFVDSRIPYVKFSSNKIRPVVRV